MSTVHKAVSLLDVLGSGEAEMALADIARAADFDKATTRRLLVALIDHSLVEQDGESRLYRLGAGIARLALMREAHFPFLRTAAPVVDSLAAATGETAHLSEHSRRGLISVHVVESAKANRIFVPLGGQLPLHATASGIAFLAFARPDVRTAALAGGFEPYTAHTIVDPAALASHVEDARRRGYSIGTQGFEEGVDSVAAPILDTAGLSIGAVALAAPCSRVSGGDLDRYGALVAAASREIGERLYGRATTPQRKRA
ncbi:MAG: IclR family transcriptional regulator [Mesorhizobium sp.]|nr:IclR family transcriptional regulator [Mesorhizobium sp.]MBN9244698.1 IclR family transcriptional regulator [Mesorhizobium sp.]